MSKKSKQNSRRHPNHIRRFRMEKGLTQQELARLLNYQSPSSLSHLEAGHKLPTLQTAMKLEAALQYFIGDIYPRLYSENRDPVARRRAAFFRNRAASK